MLRIRQDAPKCSANKTHSHASLVSPAVLGVFKKSSNERGDRTPVSIVSGPAGMDVQILKYGDKKRRV